MPRLSPGDVIERPLASGEQHAYQISAVAGRSFVAVAEQRGIDLELRVEGQDGRELAWVDSPIGSRGTERLAIRPEGSGDLRLVILAPNRGRIAGGYQIEIQELPEASKSERERAAAELRATRAAHLFRQGGRESWRLAVEEIRGALGHWREAGEEPGRALLLLGILDRRLDELGSALDALERARTRFEAEADAAGVGRAWNEIGYVHWSAGRVEPAREAYGRALAVWIELGDRHGEAQALNNLGLLDHGQGELRQALERYELAAGLFQSIGDLSQASLVQNNLAGVWDLLGEPRRALDGYQRALELMRQTDERSQEPRLLLNLAATHRALGEIQDALAGYRQALDLFRGLEDRRGEAAALNGLGMAYLDMGERLRAHGLLEQALAERRATGDRRGEAATLLNLGLLMNRLGEPREAQELLQQALVLREALGDRLGQAYTLEQLGAVDISMAQPEKALRRFEAALALRGDTGDPVGRGRALISAAEAWTSLGKLDRATQALGTALELVRETGDRSGEARTLLALAKIHRAAGRPAEALASLAEAFGCIETLRSRIASPELRASYLAARRDTYELAIDVRLDLHRREPSAGHERAALEVSEQARARSLLDLLAVDGSDLPPGTNTELVAKRQLLRERAGAKELRRLSLIASDAAPERLLRTESDLESVLLELQLVEGEIARNAQPALTATTAEIQTQLDGDALLLEYALGEKRSFLWAVSAFSLEVFELPSRTQIEALATRVYRRWSTLDTNAKDDGGAAELSRTLLGPVAARLGSRKLAIVPDGALHYIPFAALPHPSSDEPLLARHEVVTLPSSSFLVAQRRVLANRPRAKGSLAVIADPVFDARDPRVRGAAARPASSAETATRGALGDLPLFDRLTSARREAETVASLARTGETLVALDFKARRSLILDGGLAGFRIVHFATHGTFHSEHPELSGIVLSLVDEAGRPQEGFLRLPDLRSLSLAADLVVLSGCQTALGREIRGEGLVGLSSGFLDAGARNVIASLWQVPDRATAELMGSLYRGLLEKGEAPAAALRQAQLAIRARRGWSDPYHWASFILLGEGR